MITSPSAAMNIVSRNQAPAVPEAVTKPTFFD